MSERDVFFFLQRVKWECFRECWRFESTNVMILIAVDERVIVLFFWFWFYDFNECFTGPRLGTFQSKFGGERPRRCWAHPFLGSTFWSYDSIAHFERSRAWTRDPCWVLCFIVNCFLSFFCLFFSFILCAHVSFLFFSFFVSVKVFCYVFYLFCCFS